MLLIGEVDCAMWRVERVEVEVVADGMLCVCVAHGFQNTLE